MKMKKGLLLCLLLIAPLVQAERIKDLADVAGVRTNQLLGYGLVVGLDGSGDQTSQTPFTVQSLKSMLTQLGISLPPGVNPQVKNVAAVTVSAVLPAFAKPGQTIDVTVSSIGNAKSLRGGTLLMAPLKGADGEVYAVAQGNLVVGGFGAQGSDGSKITVNVPSVGRIPNGATVERTVANGFNEGNYLTLNLHRADYTTANRLSGAINEAIGPGTASAIDGSSIRVSAPLDPAQRVSYIAMLENLTLTPGEAAAKIIVNSRTGTVVIGQNVKVMPAAITHGSMSVTISEQPAASQPAPLSAGQTVVVPASEITISEENSRMFLFDPGVDLQEIVRAVNQVGAAPGDLMAILEALKEAGALRAELIVI
ncbi:MAG: flagellar basal body P-ring protein FlgI [Gammaproteobacteria bacterium]|nr:flagellar basal body P-ring protein FlgI [Gammaproteobacteria bacterium]